MDVHSERRPAGTAADKPRVFLSIPKSVRPRSNRRQSVLVGGAVAVALVVVVTSIFLLRARQQPDAYRTAEASVRTILRSVEAMGALDVAERFEVVAPEVGAVSAVMVTPGTLVHRGDVLARLDPRAAGLALDAARGSLRAADARVTDARAALGTAREQAARTRRLAERGLASEAETTAANGAAARAAAALDVARATRGTAGVDLTSAAEQHGLTTIRSPADGVVLRAPARLGAAVSPVAGPLFVIGTSPDELRIQVAVAEADVADVHPGQVARFKVPAFPGREFDAQVLRIDPDADRERGLVTYRVTLSAQNRDGLLRSGMTADVSIVVARAQNVLAVREAALRFRLHPDQPDDAAPRTRVWRVDARGGVEAVFVTPGISDGAFTEVRPGGGLRAGDRVAIGLSQPDAAQTRRPGIALGKRP
jgi:HlyD family secretion protein